MRAACREEARAAREIRSATSRETCWVASRSSLLASFGRLRKAAMVSRSPRTSTSATHEPPLPVSFGFLVVLTQNLDGGEDGSRIAVNPLGDRDSCTYR